MALSRKNFLFAGSDEGAESWAVLATLVSPAKSTPSILNAYIADILAKLVNNWPNGRLGELTPWAWKAANNTS